MASAFSALTYLGILGSYYFIFPCALWRHNWQSLRVFKSSLLLWSWWSHWISSFLLDILGLLYYFLKWTALPCKEQFDMKMIMGHVSMIYESSLERGGKTSSMSLFLSHSCLHLRFMGSHACGDMTSGKDIILWTPREWYWLVTFNCEEYHRAWVPKSWPLKSQMVRFGEDLKWFTSTNFSNHLIL